MRSNKGQALLEFVLILPIFLMLLFAMIDFGRIIYEKNRLESMTGSVVDLINNSELNDAEIQIRLERNYKIPITLKIERKKVNTIITLSRSINIITPGLGAILPDPFIAEVSRVIDSE